MNVRIENFPETRVAVIEHRGHPATEHDTVRKLIAWKLEKGLLDPQRFRSYGIHYSDPSRSDPSHYRSEFWLSIDAQVAPNPYGILEKVIPSVRCAVARDLGSRKNNRAVAHLFGKWLPASGEKWTGDPAIFHYVNVGPHVRDEDAITDVYLPLV